MIHVTRVHIDAVETPPHDGWRHFAPGSCEVTLVGSPEEIRAFLESAQDEGWVNLPGTATEIIRANM